MAILIYTLFQNGSTNLKQVPNSTPMKTSGFIPIQLEQMNQVQLMNRTDQKFWFHSDHLKDLLLAVSDEYYMLNVNGEYEIPYSTTYYDTWNNAMYISHHNGKLNRYKIRRRSYLSSGISFLEIKKKNNKGRTIKKRIPGEYPRESFTTEESEFIYTHTPFLCEELIPSLTNGFSRMTLVNKNFMERCTIDMGLTYDWKDRRIQFENLAIIEVKREGKLLTSPMVAALKYGRIKPSGFSKYCMGRSVTDPGLKKNAFKKKIRRIEKTIHQDLHTKNF